MADSSWLCRECAQALGKSVCTGKACFVANWAHPSNVGLWPSGASVRSCIGPGLIALDTHLRIGQLENEQLTQRPLAAAEMIYEKPTDFMIRLVQPPSHEARPNEKPAELNAITGR